MQKWPNYRRLVGLRWNSELRRYFGWKFRAMSQCTVSLRKLIRSESFLRTWFFYRPVELISGLFLVVHRSVLDVLMELVSMLLWNVMGNRTVWIGQMSRRVFVCMMALLILYASKWPTNPPSKRFFFDPRLNLFVFVEVKLSSNALISNVSIMIYFAMEKGTVLMDLMKHLIAAITHRK